MAPEINRTEAGAGVPREADRVDARALARREDENVTAFQVASTRTSARPAPRGGDRDRQVGREWPRWPRTAETR